MPWSPTALPGLTGADALKVELGNRTRGEHHAAEASGLVRDRWAETTLDFSAATRSGEPVDEVRFLLPEGAELLVEDVLLYEPGPER